MTDNVAAVVAVLLHEGVKTARYKALLSEIVVEKV